MEQEKVFLRKKLKQPNLYPKMIREQSEAWLVDALMIEGSHSKDKTQT